MHQSKLGSLPPLTGGVEGLVIGLFADDDALLLLLLGGIGIGLLGGIGTGLLGVVGLDAGVLCGIGLGQTPFSINASIAENTACRS